MADGVDALVRAQLRQNAEALQHAQQIAEKVQQDNQAGWYSIERPDRFRGQLSQEYLVAGAKKVKKTYGINLAAYLCGLDKSQPLSHWISGAETPNIFQAQQLRSVIEVTEILLTRMSPRAAKEWMVSPCNYLDPFVPTLPMDEMRADAEFVRRAALSELVRQ